MTIDDTRACLERILGTVAHLDPLFADLSRDRLLELWMQPGNEPDHQYAITIALKKYHSTNAPLFPYDLTTDKERFALLPSYLLAETEKRVRTVVENNAAYAFGIMDHCGFSLEQDVRSSLIENRIQEEMQQNGHKYWRTIHDAASPQKG